MSITTTSDKNIEEAKEHIQEAIKCLSTVVEGECYGSNEYTEEYLKRITKTYFKLIKLKRKLS